METIWGEGREWECDAKKGEMAPRLLRTDRCVADTV